MARDSARGGPARRRRARTSRAETSKRRARRRAKSWVREVQATSDAMDLPPGIFKQDAQRIARGLRRAVLRSRRTKGTKFQSAMSMLNLYLNRAGRALPRRERARLEAAKDELRKVFNRPPAGPRRVPRPAGLAGGGRTTQPRA